MVMKETPLVQFRTGLAKTIYLKKKSQTTAFILQPSFHYVCMYRLWFALRFSVAQQFSSILGQYFSTIAPK